MLKNKDQPLQFLSHSNNPLSLIRDSMTNIFTTNVDKDRSNIRIEEIINNPISLLPSGTCLIIKMINNIIEP